MAPTADHLLAIDIGNTSIKFGWFSPQATAECPPLYHYEMPSEVSDFRELADILDQRKVTAVFVASVSRGPRDRLVAWLSSACPTISVHVLSTQEFPIAVRVRHPERVGHDRLAAAVCAAAIKHPQRPAIVVDAGSAITVDLVSQDGSFSGGAILPGWQTMARALRRETDQLPQLQSLDFQTVPQVVGRFTEAAIASGLYWGSVGAVKELVSRIAETCEIAPEVMLAGGDMQSFATHLDEAVRCEPDLVLRGVAIAARQSQTVIPFESAE